MDKEMIANGVLISDQFVISSLSGLADNADDYTIYLGVFDLDDLNHFDGFKIHEIYSSTLSDLALAKLKFRVDFDDFIQPICLYDKEISPESTGIVGGYQKISVGFRNFPTMMNLSITDFDKCEKGKQNSKFYAHPLYYTQCIGESGSGFFMLHNGTFYLRGILSFWTKFTNVAAQFTHKFFCSPEDVLSFTNVSKEMKWIKEVLENSDDSKPIAVKQPKLDAKIDEKVKFNSHCFNNDCLYPGEFFISATACHRLTLTQNGSLKVLFNQRPYIEVWSSQTNGKGAEKACMLSNGNFVILDSKNQTIWQTGTKSYDPANYACIQDDGQLIVGLGGKEPLFVSGVVMHC